MRKNSRSDMDFVVNGFRAGAVAAGIKYRNRLDLGMIAAQSPVAAAGVFTTNRFASPAVQICRNRLRAGRARAIIVNSGNANTCLGKSGMRDALSIAEYVSHALGVPEKQVLISQTGVIGEPLPRGRIEDAIPDLVRSLRSEGFTDFAKAIMTTDTKPKITARECGLGRKRVKLLGIAKGSGMIRPDMATMLVYVLTDAHIHPPLLRGMLKEASAATFNNITVDGDMSTSDTLIAMASGAADAEAIKQKSRKSRAFFEALLDVCGQLAGEIIEDGEGATRTFSVEVIKAKSANEAEKVARRVAESLLVKTAFHAADPNWGRVLAAAGAAGVNFDPDKIDLVFAAEKGRPSVQVAKNGGLSAKYRERIAAKILAEKSFRVILSMNQGRAAFTVKSCDLSEKYVKINADYRS